MSRSKKEKPVNVRSFHEFFKEHMRAPLMQAANAYTFIEPPPFCRDAHEGGNPDYSRMSDQTQGSVFRGMWMDTRIGTPEDRRLALDGWALRSEYAKRNRQFSLPTVRSIYAVKAPVSDAAASIEGFRSATGRVYVSMSVLGIGFNPAGYTDTRDKLASHMLNVPRPQDVTFAPDSANEHESMTQWLSGVTKRRREAFSVLCFLNMIANNGTVSTASIFRQFPMIRQAAAALGVGSDVMREASLPWRGRNDDLVEYIMDAAPPKAGEVVFPWVRFNIQAELRRIAEKGVAPLLTALITAKHAYNHRMPRDPNTFFRITLPWEERDGVAVATSFPLPWWVVRYHHPIAVNGSHLLARDLNVGFATDANPYYDLLTDIVASNARA